MDITVVRASRDERKRLRTAAYCRVSLEGDEQENSIENQVSHYMNLIKSNPKYEFAGIYQDYGISGFIEERPGFQRMMEDARTGKIDLIITKSITRFARNTDTVLKTTRELKDLGIGVFFELQNINTLTQDGELLMTIYAAFAQGESEVYRDLSLMAKKRRFEEDRPFYNLHHAFGYRKSSKEGTFETVPEEAAVVKQIYRWVREEYEGGTIVKMAKAAGFHTRNGGDIRLSQIYVIVANVIYKGDYIMQQTYTDEKRKCRINHGVKKAWYIEDDHPAIVSRKLWEEANAVIQKRTEEKKKRLPILPMTEENYPYKNKLFCGYCGKQLHPRIASKGGQYSFYCRQTGTKGKTWCPGLSVTQKVIETWGDITCNIYITKDPDKPIPKQYHRMKESSWQKTHKKISYYPNMKPYTPDNYFYCKRIFCEKCGWPLYRQRRIEGKIVFRCGGEVSYSKNFCTGLVVPEEILNRLPEREDYYIIREEVQNGEKRYSYSCREEKPERKERPSGKQKN